MAEAMTAAAAAAGGGGADSTIRRLHRDYIENYGDAGGGPILYPIWYSPRGLVSEDRRLELAQTLMAVDACVNDLQPNGFVHDIIDPSLHSRYVDRDELEQLMQERGGMKRFRQMHGLEPGDDDDDEEEGEAEEAFNEEYTQEQLQKQSVRNQVARQDDMVRLRGSFQWVPTVVECTYDVVGETGQARFLGDIASLPPRRFCESLYSNVEHVFSSLLPLLAKTCLMNLDAYWNDPNWGWSGNHEFVEKYRNFPIPHPSLCGGTLQVVVKAQRYVLPPKSTYTGRWHTEGFTENIVAACVYYLDVTQETTGGDLSFRPGLCADATHFTSRRAGDMREIDSRDGFEGFEPDVDSLGIDDEQEGQDPRWWHAYIKNIPVSTGTAVAFSNGTPHRFRSIVNSTNRPQQRLFINFFVVDPDRPLETTTSSRPSPAFLARLLTRKISSDPLLVQLILDFVGGYCGPSMIHRKILRDKARAAMSSNRPHWAVMQFGNAGSIQYHPDGVEGLGVVDNQFVDYLYRIGRSNPYPHLQNYANGHCEHSGCQTSDLGSAL